MNERALDGKVPRAHGSDNSPGLGSAPLSHQEVGETSGLARGCTTVEPFHLYVKEELSENVFDLVLPPFKTLGQI